MSKLSNILLIVTPSGAWNWKFFDKNIWPAVCWLAIWIRKVFKKEVLISPHWGVTRASMIGMLRINKIGEISKLDPNVGECVKNRYSKYFWTILDTFWRFGHFYRFIFYFLLSIYYHHLNFESIWYNGYSSTPWNYSPKPKIYVYFIQSTDLLVNNESSLKHEMSSKWSRIRRKCVKFLVNIK